jgi:hypothetical protein
MIDLYRLPDVAQLQRVRPILVDFRFAIQRGGQKVCLCLIVGQVNRRVERRLTDRMALHKKAQDSCT